MELFEGQVIQWLGLLRDFRLATAHLAIIVYGERARTTITVCTDHHCAITTPRAAARLAENPAPTMAPAPEAETEEQAEERKQQHEQERKEYEAEQERRTEALESSENAKSSRCTKRSKPEGKSGARIVPQLRAHS